MSASEASITGDVKSPAEGKVVTDSDYIASRIAKLEAGKKPAPEAKAEEDMVDDTGSDEAEVESAKAEANEKVATVGTDKKAEEPSAKVLSKFDLEKLSEAEVQELAANLRSKAISRFGELTADKKNLQAQVAAMQEKLAQLQQGQQQNQSLAESKVDVPKEIASLSKPEEIQAKFKQATDVIEWAEAVLDNADGLMGNDVAVSVDGKDYTKAQVKEYMREARKVKDKYIPAHVQNLQLKAQREGLRQQYAERATKELEWLSGDDNDLKKALNAIISSPALKKIKDNVPEVEAEIEYIVAHAVNSMHGRKQLSIKDDGEGEAPKAKVDAKSIKLTPSETPKTVANGRGDDVLSRSVKELEKKFHTTGSDDDYLAYRTKQLASKRK